MTRLLTLAALATVVVLVLTGCEVDTQDADDEVSVVETPAEDSRSEPTPSPEPEPAGTPTPEPADTPTPQPTPTSTPQPVSDELADDDQESIEAPQDDEHADDEQLTEIAGEIDVQVRDFNHYVSTFGTLHVFGELENHGDANAEIREILVTLRDDDGSVVDAGSSHTYISVVEPGEVVPFQRTFIDTHDDFAEIEIDIDSRDPDSASFVLFENYRDFEALQGNWREGEWGNSIVGEIENVGEETADFVGIFAVGYDEEGRIQFVETTFAERETIQPGATSPFTIDFLDDSLVEPAQIRIFAEGWVVEE